MGYSEMRPTWSLLPVCPVLRRRTTQYRGNLLPPRHYSEPWTELENNIRDLKNRDSGNAPSIKPKICWLLLTRFIRAWPWRLNLNKDRRIKAFDNDLIWSSAYRFLNNFRLSFNQNKQNLLFWVSIFWLNEQEKNMWRNKIKGLVAFFMWKRVSQVDFFELFITNRGLKKRSLVQRIKKTSCLTHKSFVISVSH